MILPLIVALAVAAGDILVKIAVAGNLPFGTVIPVIDGVLQWSNVANPGMAFGLLGNSRWVFMTLSVVLLAGLAWFYVTGKNYDRCVYYFTALIFGGGVGNLIDRIVCFGQYDKPSCVVDFIDFCAFPELWQWTFNIADAAITVGAALFILYLLLFDKTASARGKTPVLYEEKKNAGDEK